MIRAVIFDMYETLVTMCRSFAYKGVNIAEDLCLKEAKFREVWDSSEKNRTLGVWNFENTIICAMKENKCFSEKLLQEIVQKRKASHKECFNHIHPEIIPMLQELREHKISIALVSNCYLEEAEVIKQSILSDYFDVMCLSCEIGYMKPQKEIYEKCLRELKLTPKECLYVGDGGSHELDMARAIGMKTMQATWYLYEGADQPVGRLKDFEQLESPKQVLDALC